MLIAMRRQSSFGPSLAFILLFLLLVLMHGSFAQVFQGYRDCRNSTLFPCGSQNHNISYPFLAEGRAQNCGHPSYNLKCINGDLTIKIDGNTYLVKDINYITSVLTVVQNVSSVDTCSYSFRNTTLDWSLFTYTNQDINLTLYNCSVLPNPLPEVGCPSLISGWNWYYYLGVNIPFLPAGSECSSSVFLPLLQQQAENLTDGFQPNELTQVLQEGFEVEWTAGSDWCNICTESGGACGYNSSKPSEQTCYCSDETRTGSCSSKGLSPRKKALIGRAQNCGHPSYDLKCINGDLTIKIDGNTYLVKDINYITSVLTVVQNVSSVDTCSYSFRNTTLDWSLFTYTNQDINLTLYNCSVLPNPLPEVGCPSLISGWNWYYYLGVNIPFLMAGSECSSSVFLPLLQQQAENLTGGFQPNELTQVLQEGFEVEWTAGSDWCNICTESGGACGYNSSKPSDQVGGSSLLGFIIFVGSCWLWCRRWKILDEYRKHEEQEQVLFPRNESSGPLASSEFFLMGIATLQAATENFSIENKLGEGGFGPVYRGTLPDGKQIAVKRLSSTSTQGFMEFKNEVMSIAKLQHRNLVRLLGCCDDRNEKLLVYEYLPNQSLNYFIFDSEKRSLLDWSKRLRIIIGIIRGLIYLHEDSRLKIIHRDLKPSNILLNHEMNPKISDFGLARIFSNDENEANTNRVVGTYGYMAPEFAMDGMFSVKSDVYSFGVLLLEIISGSKNGRSHFLQFERSLPDHAWELWEQGKGVELIDKLMVFSCPVSEILRCIHIGLLCVQENVVDRPTMSMVLHMLQTEQLVLKEPKKPPSFVKSTRDQRSTSTSSKIPSDNGLTLSSVPGR